MPVETPKMLLRERYHEAAQDYLRSLPLEHFMESTPQATQREITLASLALVRGRLSDVHLFNELLVQYPLPRKKRPGQVVPDNMVVLHRGPIEADGSYDVPLQPVGPFWVLEYVSRGSRRKDYNDNMRKYEHELKVPYYLLFNPNDQEMTLYHHRGDCYASVPPNANGRCPIEELEIEVALFDGWVRFWHRGELLPLPAEMQLALDATRQDLERSRQNLADMTRRAEAAERALAELRARGSIENS